MLSQLTRENYENCILPFWKNLIDDENGGFYSGVKSDLSPDKNAPKSTAQNSCILWFFCSAYLTYADEEALCYARHAYRFLQAACLDKENGGVYHLLTAQGTPSNTLKHTSNQAFAILALSTYYDATGEAQALETAFEIFQLVEELCTHEPGYLEVVNREFFPIENQHVLEGSTKKDKTMSTTLSMLEACTELYRVSGDENVERRLRAIVELFITKIYCPEKGSFNMFFSKDFIPFVGVQSFGADIQASWLLDKACEVLEDYRLLERVRKCTSAVAAAVYKNGLVNGSLIKGINNGTADLSRLGWAQAEAVIGFANAYKYTSHPPYLAAARELWLFIIQHIVSKTPGEEWQPEVNQNYTPSQGNAVDTHEKFPFHNGRMCFQLTKFGF